MGRHRSDLTLADRAFDEEYWQLCPELAHLAMLYRPVNSAQSSRRLLQVSLASDRTFVLTASTVALP